MMTLANHQTLPAAEAAVRANRSQFRLQLIQVFFVGLTLGMTRTVVPAVAESDYGLPKGSVGLLAMFVIAFGIVKAIMNFAAGKAAERLGRKHVLVIGWLLALPVPLMIGLGASWAWIVAATILLGMNQGLTWTMTLTSKLDLSRPDQRGLTNGLNEFFGYFAVALAGVVTGYFAEWLGPRSGLMLFGSLTILPALAIAVVFVRDSRPVAAQSVERIASVSMPRSSRARFIGLCQAGLVEKFVDAAVWIFLPVFLVARGVELAHIGWIPGIYASVWGVCQLWTGVLSDRIGRDRPIIAGMLLCALGMMMIVVRDGVAWWSASAAVTGLGMALLYPNLGAAVADIVPAERRATALGVYRFWRDLGYAVGALLLGLLAQLSGTIDSVFWTACVCMTVSAAAVWLLHPNKHR